VDTVPTPAPDQNDDAFIDAIATVMGPQPQPTAVTDAIAALSHFGPDLDRKQAALLLGMWAHRERLNAAGRLAVLAHFSDVAGCSQ
jgi:hypothetical protein